MLLYYKKEQAAAALERCCAHEAAFWATVLMESATSLDLSMEAGVGKVLGADLTKSQREKIFWKNISL